MTGFGPCEDWDPIYCQAWPAGSEGVTGYAITSATFALWSATGRVFGLCERTIRPCRRECWEPAASWWEWRPGATWPMPALYQGNWYNIACGGCPADSCSCSALDEAILPGPVHSIVSVKLDGETLAATGVYRVDDDVKLVRIDGGHWPSCQNMAAADTEANTWSVTARFGIDVPILGRQAVGELAHEIAQACVGGTCILPPSVQSLVRQGVTIDFSDRHDIAERLYFSGMFIRAVNPQRLVAGPEVYDIDGPAYRRTGTS